MPVIRLCFLWHMHQPFYKDLVTGEYRLPWVRLHALKDYYGMVKLLDEFPSVRQTFNLVPSLVTQIEDYVAGSARDPFYEVIAKPAAALSEAERHFAIRYLFQANERHQIGRYPRYMQLLDERLSAKGDERRLAVRWSLQDLTDLQVLSQLAWFEEYWMERPELAALASKGKNFTLDDQRRLLEIEKEILGSVLPAYRAAAEKGAIEISTTPFYHPILPLICDTNIGRVSSPDITLPKSTFRHPEDAIEQMQRALDFMQERFGVRPAGMWPSEGSVSNEVLGLARQLGVKWMATDEGVLGRSMNSYFGRDTHGVLSPDCANELYRVYRYEHEEQEISLVFRDHSLSDLIGFVYAGMHAKEAADHFVRQLKASAAPVLASGRDAVVSVILDGENAWEHFPQNGREFLRRLYDAIARDPQIHAETVGEAVRSVPLHECGRLNSITPGSWINANFNVWIGAAEDNRAWDLLTAARACYDDRGTKVSEPQRQLAHEELLIAEGSDWNWWYGPEHHTANDSDFDELYRNHLSNVYRALGADPPPQLAVPIAGLESGPKITPQTQYIRPRMKGSISYFDWLGAATYVAPALGAMHGGIRKLGSIQAGFDDRFLYVRLDFLDGRPQSKGECALEIESVGPTRILLNLTTLHFQFVNGTVQRWWMSHPNAGNGNGDAHISPEDFEEADVRLTHVLEVRVQQSAVRAVSGGSLRLRFHWIENGVPLDSLPREGSMILPVLSEADLEELVYKHW